MIACILVGGAFKRTGYISVDLEKCVPCVGIYKGGRIAREDLYKILVLDSILIDCDRKMVYWSCDRLGLSLIYKSSEGEVDTDKVLDYFGNKEKLVTEHMVFQNGPRFDDLFKKAENIFQYLSPEMFENDGNVAAYAKLLEMLQVYILPEVKFQRKHQEVVQEVLDKITNKYDSIEMRITTNTQTLTDYKKSLANKRKQILEPENVLAILNSEPRDEQFIDLLLKHVESDVNKINGTLIHLTDKLDALRPSTDEVHLKHYKDTRAERDKVLREKEFIMNAREELTHGISNCQVLHESKLVSNAYGRYKQEAAKIESLINDIRQQINNKIRLSSIRKSVTTALKQI